MLPGSGHQPEFNLVASLAAQQQAAAAGLAGLYSHSVANHHDTLHAHQWSRQDPSRHGKLFRILPNPTLTLTHYTVNC